jgi:hypothetical protein
MWDVDPPVRGSAQSPRIIAYNYNLTPGYVQGFSFIGITLFYTTRPRLGWIILVLSMQIGQSFRDNSDVYYVNTAKGTILAQIALLVIGNY